MGLLKKSAWPNKQKNVKPQEDGMLCSSKKKGRYLVDMLLINIKTILEFYGIL